MRKVLTIAGSDCSGGAGIQADIKTMAVHNVYGMSVLTALTAQNTTGVYDIMEVTPEFVEKQLTCIFEDIPPDTVKIGMVSNEKIIKSITKKLKEYQAKALVIDPVMVSTSGSKLLSDEAIEVFTSELFSMAKIITPNIPEAEVLSGVKIISTTDMRMAAKELNRKYKVNILIKGGHLKSTADDLLYIEEKEYWLKEDRIDNPNTHGTGCTLSTAIACNLALGYNLVESVTRAKEYVTSAIRDGLDLGRGNGPLNHSFPISKLFQ